LTNKRKNVIINIESEVIKMNRAEEIKEHLNNLDEYVEEMKQADSKTITNINLMVIAEMLVDINLTLGMMADNMIRESQETNC
jgi:hypothetical protein